MNTYTVQYLNAQGRLVHRTMRAFTARAAEYTCAQLVGGEFHEATLLEDATC